jgi:hypothetical protein
VRISDDDEEENPMTLGDSHQYSSDIATWLITSRHLQLQRLLNESIL